MRKFTRWLMSFLVLFLSCIKLLAIGHAVRCRSQSLENFH